MAGSKRWRPMRVSCYLAFVFALCFAFDQQSFSQTIPPDQRELIRSQAPSPFGPNASPGGVEGGQAVPTPNDSDLGEQQILKRWAEWKAVRLCLRLTIPIWASSRS